MDLYFAFVLVVTCTARLLFHTNGQNLGQEEKFQNFLKLRRDSVFQVASRLENVLSTEGRCDATKTCNQLPCSIHPCSGSFGEDFRCVSNVSIVPCQENNNDVTFRREELCKAGYDPSGSLLSDTRPVLRTPISDVTSTGNGAPILVTDSNVRGDICSLKSMTSFLAQSYKNNQLTSWLYAGTTNKAFVLIPGTSACRTNPDNLEENESTFSSCQNYDPTTRPWFITSASGPRDIVFLFDTTSLTSSGSLIRPALLELLGKLDSRDMIAFVAFNSIETTTIPSNQDDSLRSAISSFVDSLKDEINLISASEGLPKVSLALEKAFDILQTSELEDQSSGCSKFIVLMTGKEDECFNECRGPRCTCVQEVLDVVSKRQADFSSSVSIVGFTEKFEDELRTANMERMIQTIVCSNETSGVWQRVDSSRRALSAFEQLSAFNLYEANPTVFASQIYEDNFGTGEMFTLSVPVYERNKRRLVGVAGVDVTVSEVASVVGEKDTARELITAESRRSRKCPTEKQRDGCALQAIRSQRGSGFCADIISKSEGKFTSCFKFGDFHFKLFDTFATFNDANVACQNFSEGSFLAVVDSDAKNVLLSGLFDPDGTWIGLKSPENSGLRWIDNSSANPSSFQFGFTNVSKIVDFFKEENGVKEVCVSGDRRGTKLNWNIEKCTNERRFLCQIPAPQTGCHVFVDFDSRIGRGINPTGCPDIDASEECSQEEKAALSEANPFCNQSGAGYDEFDRTCCGGAADASSETLHENESDGGSTTVVGLVVGISIGTLILLGILLLFVWKSKQRKDRADRLSSGSVDGGRNKNDVVRQNRNRLSPPPLP